jgi:hypothetical protein
MMALAFNPERNQKEFLMKIATTVLVVGALFAGTAWANAAGVSEKTPGEQMQDKGRLRVARAHPGIPRATKCRKRVL